MKPRWNMLECSSSKPGSSLLKGWESLCGTRRQMGDSGKLKVWQGFWREKEYRGGGEYRQEERWETVPDALLVVSTCCFFIPHSQTSSEVRACACPISQVGQLRHRVSN